MKPRRLVTAILITLSYQALVVFYYYIDKYTSGIPYLILVGTMVVLFIVILVSIIKGIIQIIKNRKNLTFAFCLPTLVYLVVPFVPLPSAEILESKVVLRGCYQEAINEASLQLRQNHSFDVHSTSFFYSKWRTGHWQRRGDTIWLKYDRQEIDHRLGQKVLIDSGYFKPLGYHLKKDYAMFYVGDCRGDD